MSIKKIAQLSGSSPATVSRILNNPNYKCSTPGLREKVWKIAMELNYTPNEAARSLKKGCSKNKLDTYSVDILMTRMVLIHIRFLQNYYIVLSRRFMHIAVFYLLCGINLCFRMIKNVNRQNWNRLSKR